MEKTANTDRAYKSSVFSSLLSEYLYELPKVVPIEIPPGIIIEDVTLNDAIIMEQINDLALLVGSLLLLFFEHQSTINYNMCVRLLLYCARTYEKILDRKLMYGTKQVKIPRPLFFVFYNGAEDLPDMTEMKLSDAYEDVRALPGADSIKKLQSGTPLELTLTVINLLKHGSKVNNMLLQEWDLQTALDVRAEEAYEKAKEEYEAEIDKITGERDHILAKLSAYEAKYGRLL